MPARTARSSRRKAHQFAPAESILGPLPLFEGEDPCEELLRHVRAAITPPSFLVELSVRQIVYHTCSIARYQRYEAELSKKLEESEKIYHADRATELAILMARLARAQQMITTAEQRRYRAYKEIEYLGTKFVRALRRAIDLAMSHIVEEPSNGGGSPATGPTA